jgi:hypothetical protein
MITMSPSQQHTTEVAAVSVGGLLGLGKLLSMIEPFLADASYFAAIIVAIVTVYYKIKNRGK